VEALYFWAGFLCHSAVAPVLSVEEILFVLVMLEAAISPVEVGSAAHLAMVVSWVGLRSCSQPAYWDGLAETIFVMWQQIRVQNCQLGEVLPCEVKGSVVSSHPRFEDQPC